jgi:hypothetical protein
MLAVIIAVRNVCLFELELLLELLLKMLLELLACLLVAVRNVFRYWLLTGCC